MKRIIAVLALAAVVGALHVEVALAAKAATRLTMRIDDTSVGSNDTIHVRGRLRSERARCISGRTITLYIRGAAAGTTQTDAEGRYHFAVPGPHPEGTHKFQTRFAGNRRCKPSQGPSINVTVS